MSQASTKIEDLPDNNKEPSSEILQQLNDDISQTSDEEYPTPKEIKKPLKNKGISYLNWDYILTYGKDALIVFVILFVISNNNVISLLSNLPYIKSYEPHSMIYNVIISLVVALLYFITKYSSYIYCNL